MQVQQDSSQDSNADSEQTIRALQQKIDELTTANLALQEQLARKEQFTAMIAHELRSPLTSIISYAQMLIRTSNTSSEKSTNHTNGRQRSTSIQRASNVIFSQGRRLARLVNDLLDSSHLTSGKFTLVRENCDIVVLVSELLDLMRPVAPYHTLVLDAPATAVTGYFDGGRIQQVLGNLLDNAIKYSDEQTTITVRIWTSSDKVHVSVHNQGTSIPSAEVGLLFQPYSRLPAATAGTRRGVGLGLHIARSIIEAHGGELRLEPRTDDSQAEISKGTTFSFTLPLT